jgi:hypothetical protein
MFRKCLAAMAGPIVWLLEGPRPLLYMYLIDGIESADVKKVSP